MVSLRNIAAVACLVASASAFTASPMGLRGSFVAPTAITQRPAHASRPAARSSALPALRMQTEDEKAKAAGVSFAVIGLIATKFSILGAVILGGGAVYCGAIPSAPPPLPLVVVVVESPLWHCPRISDPYELGVPCKYHTPDVCTAGGERGKHKRERKMMRPPKRR